MEPPDARTRPPGRRRLVRPLAVGALLALASASAAQDTPEESARRMDDRRFFVQAIGRGWRPLLADIGRAIEETPAEGATPIRLVRDRAAEAFAEICHGEATEAGRDEAYRWFGVLAKDAVDTGRRRPFAERAADIDVARAKEFVAARKDDDARAALHRGLDLAPGHPPALDLLTEVVLRASAALEADGREDFGGALRVLDEGLADLPEGSPWAGRVSERRRHILATTGVLSVDWVGDPQALSSVPGARTDFRAATLTFRAADGTAAGRLPPPQPLAQGRDLRVRNGRYRAVLMAGGAVEQDAGVVEIGAAEAVAPVVTIVPDGMLVVRAPEGADWFLVDRTEVPNGEFRRVLGRSTGNDDRAAAAGVTFAEAQEYAKRVSKQLPTRDQWKIAAFGTANPSKGSYPWGGNAAVPGRHFQGGRSSPGPVDACAEGASPFGALNLAGNVWEWLADGWLIGGGWEFEELFGNFPESVADKPHDFYFLHDPLPTEEIYLSLSAADRNVYYTYRAGENTLPQAGLRCVIRLGRPRRP